jgi:hypothetical protein
MEKVALLFRGPVRPELEPCVANFHLLKTCFNNYEITTFVVAWDTEMGQAFKTMNIADHCVLLPKPTDQDMFNNLSPGGTQPFPKLLNFGFNAYRQMINVRALLDLMDSTKITFDWVVIARLDQRMRVDPRIYMFDGAYTAPNVDTHPINDQFGIGRPNIVRRAWDYETFENMAHHFRHNDNPEEALQSQAKARGIVLRQAGVVECTLHPKRK